jgi:NADPH-dependent curcumin reductase CurA
MVLIDDHWRDHAVRRASDCKRLDPSVAPVQSALGVLGMTGRTAYVGLKHIGKPKAGETLVVGAATGAVGSIVGQIARLQGARAIGVAGGSEKCRFATETLGFDACLDRHLPDLPGRLAEVCPDGVDVYFELTGGKVLDAVLPLLNEFARIPACGTVASYNATALPAGPDRLQDLMRLIVSRSLTVCGFIVDDHEADRPAFEVEMTAWLASGQVKHHEHIAHGLDSMVPAFIGMLDGQNLGKTLVRLDQA